MNLNEIMLFQFIRSTCIKFVYVETSNKLETNLWFVKFVILTSSSKIFFEDVMTSVTYTPNIPLQTLTNLWFVIGLYQMSGVFVSPDIPKEC